MAGRRATNSSSSSSIDSSNSNHPSLSQPNTDLSTDLRLGLSISTFHHHHHSSSYSREQRSDWPPIKPHLRSALAGKGNNLDHLPTFFVKVYMEGIPIGRKLDLFAQDGYDALVRTLGHMFRTTILCPDVDRVHSKDYHVLTYEDKDGDWMMVGDVPWEMFLTTVKRLKITSADIC
ncbi:hypothetical protein HHK36_012136 [Tetracentron sinense]|uniref:Auxin-responsive protein n=1 Tax=Tetracentron sinense TaxID=13715 RepID=A0A835DHT4_TETSI|nr:hypothetical protein HHK36_012136 [Tetracentron sinense]